MQSVLLVLLCVCVCNMLIAGATMQPPCRPTLTHTGPQPLNCSVQFRELWHGHTIHGLAKTSSYQVRIHGGVRPLCPATPAVNMTMRERTSVDADGRKLPPYKYTLKQRWGVKLNFMSGRAVYC